MKNSSMIHRFFGTIAILTSLVSLLACQNDSEGLDPPSVDVTGTWRGNSSEDLAHEKELLQTGNTVSGTVTSGNEVGDLSGTVEGDRLQFVVVWPHGPPAEVHATIDGDTMAGSVVEGSLEGHIFSRRK